MNDVERVFADIEKNVLANSNSPTTEHLQERISNYLEVEYPKKIWSTIYVTIYLIQKFVESIRDDKIPPVTGEEGRKVIALQEKIFNLSYSTP